MMDIVWYILDLSLLGFMLWALLFPPPPTEGVHRPRGGPAWQLLPERA
jgi:hypothetical protein